MGAVIVRGASPWAVGSSLFHPCQCQCQVNDGGGGGCPALSPCPSKTQLRGRLQELPSLSSKPLSHLGPWQPTGSLAHVVQRRELGGLLLSQYQILNQRCSEVAVKISRGGLTRRKKDYGKFRHASLKQPTSLECVRLLSPMYKLWPFRRRPSHPKTWPPCA